MLDTTIRTVVLRSAERVITKDRHDQYGEAEDSFALIARYWSAHLGVEVSAFDVAQMMTLLKIARARSNPAHLDNYIDAAGYTALAAEMVVER